MRVTLKPHPETIDAPTLTVEVEIAREGGRLWLRYVVEGDVEAVQWPAPAAADRTDGLWAHTCFEAFIRTDDGYREFNLSPSGQWAAYRFDAYRQGMTAAVETASVSGLGTGQDHFALEALVDPPAGMGRIGLSVVIEDINGRFSYWALAHPAAKPDFHHPDSFVLDLP